MNVLLALPAYNEEDGLPRLFESFQREVADAGYSVQVVVVDDGSKDRTLEVVHEWSSRLPVDVVVHPANRGLGETIRDALKRAVELASADDVIVTMDSDNTHSPALIPKMLEQIRDGSEVVIASRYRPGAAVVGLSAFRHVMSYGARFLFQATFPIPGVRDYTCGFRAYKAPLLKRAFALYGADLVTERSFACMAEILLKLAKMKAPMSEVPMVLRYDQKQGTSKMRVGSTVWKTLRLIARTRLGAPASPAQQSQIR